MLNITKKELKQYIRELKRFNKKAFGYHEFRAQSSNFSVIHDTNKFNIQIYQLNKANIIKKAKKNDDIWWEYEDLRCGTGRVRLYEYYKVNCFVLNYYKRLLKIK